MLGNDMYLSFLCTHHIFDLWQCDLQRDIKGFVCVLYRSQSIRIVLHQVIQKFAGIMTLSTMGHWGGERRAEVGYNSKGYNRQISGNCRDKSSKHSRVGLQRQNKPEYQSDVNIKLIHHAELTLHQKADPNHQRCLPHFQPVTGRGINYSAKQSLKKKQVQLQSVTLFWSPFSPAEAERAETTENSQNLTSCQKLWMLR